MSKKQILEVLAEGIEGPQGARTYYLDTDAGLTNTLARLSAADASRPVGGNSIAAHVGHIVFSFDAFGASISGDRSPRDWNESWRIGAVDETAWQKLRAEVESGYARLRNTIETHADANEDALASAAAAAAHLAYHIGAIRQKVAFSA
jgi:DinB superfamily